MTPGRLAGCGPLVSCVMPTANRRAFVPRAIARFLAQDHDARELLIVDDGDDRVEDLVPADPRVRYIPLPRRTVLGAKRNLACEAARGDILVHWDDDDWSASWRVRYQVEQLARSGADACGLDTVIFHDPAAADAWVYRYPRGGPSWVYGATLAFTKDLWRRNPFPSLGVGEDSRFLWSAVPKRVLALDERAWFVATVHQSNTSRKQTRGTRWQPYPVAAVHALLARDGVSLEVTT